MSGTYPVFVYGTLLRGEANHGVLKGARFVMETTTESGFALFDLGRYPAMCRTGSRAVWGEVYRVDARVLARLDALEEHPAFYHRMTIALRDGSNAYGYLMDVEVLRSQRRIGSGSWRDRT